MEDEDSNEAHASPADETDDDAPPHWSPDDEPRELHVAADGSHADETSGMPDELRDELLSLASAGSKSMLYMFHNVLMVNILN